MVEVYSISDPAECQRLWRELMPAELVSDLWEVRDCFHREYRHQCRFVVAEEHGRIIGFVPLSYNEETEIYNYFPGETWEGKTWLEQNRIIARDRRTLELMLATLDAPHQLRYLRTDTAWRYGDDAVDEIGYLFFPDQFDFKVERYFDLFSHKSAKRLKKELAGWDDRNVELRINQIDDFELLCQMNRSRYGRLSYFTDDRFLQSFRNLVEFLDQRGWLRIVTLLVDGEPAAVDMGSLYNGMLTMLAGGTNAAFPGIAKLINMHHFQYACERRLDSVDFLCGDFNWKTQFHLTPASLYVIDNTPARNSEHVNVQTGMSIESTDPLMGAANV